MQVTTSRIRIAAPATRVWAALTEPALVERWQYGSELATDWRPGSPIRFTSRWQGDTFEQRGTVLEVEAPRRLSYSLFAPRPGLEDRPEQCFTMSYLLEDDGDDGATTLLTITQEDPRQPDASVAGDEESPVLAALKALLERA